MTRVVWTLRAVENLEAILAYIARSSARYAALHVERLFAAADRLQQFPESGRVVPELQRPDIREAPAKPTRVSAASIRKGTTMRKHYDFSKARRGPILPVSKGKTRITIRLDTDLLDWFRARVNEAGGGNYQTLINQALRRIVEGPPEPLEVVVRRVVRQELGQAVVPRQRKRKARAA